MHFKQFYGEIDVKVNLSLSSSFLVEFERVKNGLLDQKIISEVNLKMVYGNPVRK